MLSLDSYLQKELKYLDIRHFFPKHLEPADINKLCDRILEDDYHVKEGLRRGVWMHLLGVFHPGLHLHEQRENYIGKLRLVYDTLRNKWAGDTTTWNPEVHQLAESVRRDGIRTDPTESFLAGTAGLLEDDNLEKLVRVTMIYTLEHPEVKYTQGMTDILSPLLYVMKSEEDAYICFAAMFTRLRDNFSLWCDGALNKLERLKHLCEVLDPELFAHMTLNVAEDPFILFFGMVLIECRREFSFQDSLHLLEVIMAASYRKRKLPRTPISESDWASFMTTESEDVILQVFGEVGSPYSSHPLEQEGETRRVRNRSSQLSYSGELSRSLARQIPRPDSMTCVPSSNQVHITSRSVATRSSQSTSITITARERSVSVPNAAFSPLVEIHVDPTMVSAHSDGQLVSHAPLGDEEGELQDSLGELHERINTLPTNAEMSDMSSICSSSKGSNGMMGTSTNSSFTSLKSSRKSRKCSEETNGLISREGLGRRSGTKNSNTAVCSCVTRGFSTVEDSAPSPSGTPSSDSHHQESRSEEFVISNGFPPHEPPRELELAVVSSVVARGDVSEAEEHQTAPVLSQSLPNTYLTSEQSNVRGLDHPIPVYADDPFLPSAQHRRRASTDSCISPLPSFFSAMDRMRNQPNSLEASMEVSHVISQLVSIDRRPAVSRESSLQIKISNNYSLFICLAILINHRTEILEQEMDFVNLSMVINSDGSQNLSVILKLARQLRSIYAQYQAICSDTSELWLDEDCASFSLRSQILPHYGSRTSTSVTT